MTFMTDPEDDSVVWIDGLCQGLYGYPSNDYRFYGNATVEEDGSVSSISLPCGQSAASTANGNELSLWIFDGQGGVGNTGNITMTQTSPGVFTINEGYGIGYDAGNNQVSLFGLYYAGAVLTKNE